MAAETTHREAKQTRRGIKNGAKRAAQGDAERLSDRNRRRNLRSVRGKIREYEEEVNFLNEEYNLRQKLLEAAMKQEFPVVLCEDEAGPSDNATSPESPQIKTEESKPQEREGGS
ncbi:hypothetical protein WMY93_020125 [Mugilogobius chulae]|uniref:BZIP domain-containing protein n=1 Tax=Mugilogobius chulae TaxID=88201 RepID=A0AAW0NL38_9GOBI